MDSTFTDNFFHFVFSTAPQAIWAFLHKTSMVSLFNLFWAIIVILIATYVYVNKRNAAAVEAERKKYWEKLSEAKVEPIGAKRAKDWAEVKTRLGSATPSDWKIAVLEADTILSELLEDLQIPGENTGERLKNVSAGTMRSIDQGWSAHKLRNRIAHEGINAEIDKQEINLAIENFEKVFKEFSYI